MYSIFTCFFADMTRKQENEMLTQSQRFSNALAVSTLTGQGQHFVPRRAGFCIDESYRSPLVSLFECTLSCQGSTAPFGTRRPTFQYTNILPRQQQGMLDERRRVAKTLTPALVTWEPCTHDDKRARNATRIFIESVSIPK